MRQLFHNEISFSPDKIWVKNMIHSHQHFLFTNWHPIKFFHLHSANVVTLRKTRSVEEIHQLKVESKNNILILNGLNPAEPREGQTTLPGRNKVAFFRSIRNR